MSGKIRVLILDDSAVMRQLLRGGLEADAALEVVGVAPNPDVARDKIRALRPDVLTLDVEMPGMNGLTFLEQLMRESPMPVVMVSSFTESGCSTTLRALELGAVDFVTKPAADVRDHLSEWAQLVADKVRAAGVSRPRRSLHRPLPSPRKPSPRGVTIGDSGTGAAIVAIGASTGGPEAVQELLSTMPPDCPPILIVQHMPPRFTRAFADRLNNLCEPHIKEAEDGDRVQRGQVLIAPGDYHMRLARGGSGNLVRLSQDPPVNRHRPSVDVLFQSCAEVGGRMVGVILTGMGEDGAHGLLAMREVGAHTIAQDEATSVIYGMPRAAADLGAATIVLPLERIAEALLAR
jgi:two-component system chemotaxis response regulator CheB